METRKQNKYLIVACGIILACIAIGYMFPGKVRSLFSMQQRGESITQDGQFKSAALSYKPNCSNVYSDSCLSGTEIQALESFKCKLYVGTTNWGETNASIWPKTSAQINVLATEGGEWQRTPDLPLPAGCKQGYGGWEQINDLHTATFTANGLTATHLFTGPLINEDGECPGVHASVFYLNDASTTWVDTGLTTQLQNFYGSMNSEVRYFETFSDNTEACREDRPCVFAFVGPRDSASGTKFPTVWRGVYAPDNKACNLICWDNNPEVHFNGIEAPIASRIVTSYAGKAGLYVGTSVPESIAQNAGFYKGSSPVLSELCNPQRSKRFKCLPLLQGTKPSNKIFIAVFISCT